MSRITLTYLWPLFFAAFWSKYNFAQTFLNEVTASEISEVFNATTHHSKIDHRIERYSAFFVKKATPYVGGPAGEGVNGDFNQLPISNWTRFDCVTYVESILSLALIQKRYASHHQNLDEYYENLKRIKYFDDNISYLTRNHFTELDWIPYLNKIDVLKDVTRSVFRKSPLRTKLVDKHKWYMNKTIGDLYLRGVSDDDVDIKLQKLQELKTKVADLNLKPISVSLRYIPFAELKKAEVQKRLPKVSIFSLVRGDHPTKDIATMISHQGFLIKLSPNRIVIRHASTSTLNVVDVDFNEYIEKRLLDSWPSLGLNLQIVRD